MTTPNTERELIDRSRDALYMRLSSELKHADDEESAEQFLGAESVVDQYLDATAQGTASLPDRQDLAFACALLLVTTRTIQKRDLELLGRLNATEIGISLFSISGQIEEMRTRAIAGLAKLAQAGDAGTDLPLQTPSPDGDVPF
ncbi:hypothetical protein [Burkholderia vietnamiensis]|uniref:hypothetical protein n=1 Tax=Burkholderia vietnamiensis TaxID=60552 RepID=UPI000841499A|nr:hypothetical protein [Burkholderia vietnamiensis]AOK42568.1 hypothetical protein WL96_15550 [Burkholderia vietnamiensis]